MKTTPALLLPLLLAACSTPGFSTHEAASIHEPVVYSCEGGLTLRVRFARDGAHVTMPSGEEVYLRQQPAGSGTDYASEQAELRGKGEEATWQAGRRTPIGCRVQR